MNLAVVGVDGLDPHLVSQWEDDLPTLQSLIQGGTFSKLHSSHPPLSSPAWPTLFTGKQSGKHGVFGFTKEVEGTHRREPINYSDVMSESLWEALDASGVACGVANVPISYPPTSLENGFLLSGWPIPNRADTISHPKSLLSELEAEIDEPYQVNPFPMLPELSGKSPGKIVDTIVEGMRHHHRAFTYLLESHDVDVFFGVYMAIDHASHHLAWTPEKLKEVYIKQDQVLNDLIGSLDDDTDVVVVSDHGHGIQGNRKFYTNEWLMEEGYLSLKESTSNRLRQFGKRAMQSLGIHRQNVLGIKDLLGLDNIRSRLPDTVFRFLKRTIPDEQDMEYDPGLVDWEETVAYAPDQNVVYINDIEFDHSEKERVELRNEIAYKLRSIDHPDPEIDGSLMSKVTTSDTIFQGPYSERGPDIICIADDMRCGVHASFNSSGIFGRKHWGEHREYGVLLTNGPTFKNLSNPKPVAIEDVFPMVLLLAGAEIPQSIDGSISEERIKGEIKPVYRSDIDMSTRDSSYSASEAEDIRDQLEGLGYLR